MGTDTGPDWLDSAACISSDGFSIATLGNCNVYGKGSTAAIGGLGISSSPWSKSLILPTFTIFLYLKMETF